MTETIARTVLAGLLERVRKATGNDDALTRDMCRFFMDRSDYPEIAPLITFAMDGTLHSIGAALGLVERVLPGWAWTLDFYSEYEPALRYACVLTDSMSASARATTAPLAILCAMLTALEERR